MFIMVSRFVLDMDDINSYFSSIVFPVTVITAFTEDWTYSVAENV